MTSTEITKTIFDFVRSIGIAIRYGPVNDETFLPGIEVAQGGLIVDPSKLLYPGDILHEAGHLAVTPENARAELEGTVDSETSPIEVVEVEAMCWSYAACVHLGLDPRVVFHANGYHGRSEALLQNFRLGVFPGLAGLEAAGLTLSPATAEDRGAAPFPAMIRWLRR